MKVSDIVFEMELSGVDEADITEILSLCKSKGYDSEALDDALEKKGYSRIFTLDYDDDDEYDDWKDDEYSSVKKFPQKNNYKD